MRPLDFKKTIVITDKERYFIIIKASTLQREIMVVSICVHNNIVPKHETKLDRIKRKNSSKI